jgi:hypothetical protein
MADGRLAVRSWTAGSGPFLAALGHEKRRRWAPVYLRGLLGPGERKSLQPMAARLGLGGHDQLQHFVASPAWDDAPLRRLLVERADALVGGPDAVLGGRRHRPARSRAGTRSGWPPVLRGLGQARQLPGPGLAHPGPGRGARAGGLALFLPEAWAADPDRCARAGVPDEHRRAEAKTAIALAEIDRVLAAGARFGRVVADAGLRDQRRLPPGPQRARPGLGGRHPEGAERLLDSGRAALAQGGHGTAAQAPRAERGAGPGRGGPGGRRVAPDQLAARHQGAARGRVRRREGATRRRERSSATAGTCPARRSGWSASAGPRASASTTSRTCRPTRRSRSWRR